MQVFIANVCKCINIDYMKGTLPSVYFFHVCIIAKSTTINSPLPFHGKRRRSPAAFLFGKPPICNASPTALRPARSPDVQLKWLWSSFCRSKEANHERVSFLFGWDKSSWYPTGSALRWGPVQFTEHMSVWIVWCGWIVCVSSVDHAFKWLWLKGAKGTQKLIMFSVRVHFLVQQFWDDIATDTNMKLYRI